MRLTYRRLAEGEAIPRFYGVAYHEWCSCYIVAYPIPINIIVGFARRAWARLVAGMKPDKIAQAYQAGFREGVERQRKAAAAQAKHMREIEWGALRGSISAGERRR